MQDAGQRKFDVILCWKLDRFGRSLLHCKSALQELQAHGVRFIATSQNIDRNESNPAARFLLHILMAAAEFERELIRERSMAGLKRYRGQYAAGKVGKEVHSRSEGSACRTAQADFCPAGCLGTTWAGPQLPPDRQADGDWRRDGEAGPWRMSSQNCILPSLKRSRGVRGRRPSELHARFRLRQGRSGSLSSPDHEAQYTLR
jgi:hypothetical protein